MSVCKMNVSISTKQRMMVLHRIVKNNVSTKTTLTILYNGMNDNDISSLLAHLNQYDKRVKAWLASMEDANDTDTCLKSHRKYKKYRTDLIHFINGMVQRLSKRKQNNPIQIIESVLQGQYNDIVQFIISLRGQYDYSVEKQVGDGLLRVDREKRISFLNYVLWEYNAPENMLIPQVLQYTVT